jgi:hypothetical protein
LQFFQTLFPVPVLLVVNSCAAKTINFNMADKKSTKQDELTSSRTEKTESPADFLGSCFE